MPTRALFVEKLFLRVRSYLEQQQPRGIILLEFYGGGIRGVGAVGGGDDDDTFPVRLRQVSLK